jgi:hypothetical protein
MFSAIILHYDFAKVPSPSATDGGALHIRCLEQLFVIKYLGKKHWERDAVCHEFLHVSGADVYDEHSVKLWNHETELGREELTDRPNKVASTLDDLDAFVSHQLTREPFSSVPLHAESIRIPHAMIHCHLTESLGMLDSWATEFTDRAVQWIMSWSPGRG